MGIQIDGMFNLQAAQQIVSPFVENRATPSIYQIESLSQISKEQPEHTIFFVDIDDTVFDSFSMLGSKAWRRYIVQAAKNIDPSQNWHDILSYRLAEKNHPLLAVEGDLTRSFIRELQQKGYIVCGLTSRERSYWYETPQKGIDELTIGQLSGVGVNFDNKSLENIYPYLSMNDEYYKGVMFADLEPKGEYLIELFEKAPQFKGKVIFIDDKDTQVASVDAALKKLGIPHECYTYTATEKKGKAFNPLYANIELFHFYQSDGKQCLTDQEAKEIAEANPDKDAEHYLKATLELASAPREPIPA